MDDRAYTQWKAREEDYRALRRKRSHSIDKRAAYLWNATNPAIRYEDLIETWQQAVSKFVHYAESGDQDTAAGNWLLAAPWHSSRDLDTLSPPWFREALEEVFDVVTR